MQTLAAALKFSPYVAGDYTAAKIPALRSKLAFLATETVGLAKLSLKKRRTHWFDKVSLKFKNNTNRWLDRMKNLLPSSRGLGHSPFKAATGVQIPVGALVSKLITAGRSSQNHTNTKEKSAGLSRQFVN
jgi:hypothetical protein